MYPEFLSPGSINPDWKERMLALENRVHFLEHNVETIQSQQRLFYERTTNAIDELQKSAKHVEENIHTLIMHQEDIIPLVQKLGLWLQQGGFINEDIKD